MEWSLLFFFNSALLGVGLAMDAFSVSMANGLHDPRMSRSRGVQVAGTFAVFQAAMPDRKSTRLNSSHRSLSRMPSSA